MIRAGRKDRKIIIQRATITADAIGAPSEVWSTHLTVWAEVVPISGKESLAFDQVVSSEMARFIIHYQAGITAKDRISYNSKSWNIRQLREIGRRVELEILAEVTE